MMLKNIQSLRFIAAMWVVLHHMTPPVTPFRLTWLPESISQLGFAGVDIFFVISGLIMAETTRSMPPGWQSSSKFLAQRFGRIYIGWWPYFFAYLAGASILNILRPEVSLMGSFFLWPQDLMLYLLPITWTLSFELYFYFMVALIVLWNRKYATAVIASIGTVVVLMNIYFHHKGLYLPINEGAAKVNLLVPFYASPLIIEFVAGFLLAEFFHRRKKLNLFLWGTGALVFLLAAAYHQLHGKLYSSGMAGFFYVTERAILFGGFSACVVACALELERRDLTPFKWMQKLGDASYSMYLGHIIVLTSMAIIYSKIHFANRINQNLWAIIAIALTSLLAWISFSFMEKPLNNIFKKYLSKAIHRIQ